MSHSIRQLTIRGLPEDFCRELEREAHKKGTSLNKLLLNRILPVEKKKMGLCADLLQLAGTWNAKRASEFEEKLQDHRKIDRGLWS